VYRLSLCLAATAVVFSQLTAAEAEKLRVGYPTAAPVAPIFIAQEKGYYAAEGLDVELVPFDAAGPIPVAITSGSVDIALAGSTASFFSLAGQGAVKIIAGAVHEVPGFHAEAVVATNKGYAAGVTSLKDLGGHSLATTTIGSSFYYALGLVAEKHAIDLKSLRIVQTQQNANTVSAVAGDQVDFAVGTFTGFTPLIHEGKAKLLAYIGDEVPWQIAFILTSSKIADSQPATVEHWLAAYRHAAKDYHDAFTNAEGAREDQAGAPAILAIMEKYLKQSAERLDSNVGYVDPEGRLDVPDVHHQAEWFAAQGLVKGKPDADKIIASRYIRPWTGVH
jgi:NitT/TauT family transport system substrate-binding protein